MRVMVRDLADKRRDVPQVFVVIHLAILRSRFAGLEVIGEGAGELFHGAPPFKNATSNKLMIEFLDDVCYDLVNDSQNYACN